MPIVATAKRPGWVATSFARPYDLKAGSVGDRLRAVRPTLFLGVPRVWEKVAEKIKKLGELAPAKIYLYPSNGCLSWFGLGSTVPTAPCAPCPMCAMPAAGGCAAKLAESACHQFNGSQSDATIDH